MKHTYLKLGTILLLMLMACNTSNLPIPGGSSEATATATLVPSATPVPEATSTPLPPTEEPEEEPDEDEAEEVETEEEEAPAQSGLVYSIEVRGLMAADSNFRVGPTLESEIIRQLQGGLPVYLQGRNDAATWVQIVPSDADEVGWVAFSQIETVSDETAIGLPIAQGQTLPDIPVGFATNLDFTPAPPPPTPIPTVDSDPQSEPEATEEDDGTDSSVADLPFNLEYNTDLLQNGSFEQPYQPWELLDGGGLVANQWEPWWFNDDGPVYDGPEYTMANIAVDPSRIVSGEDAQQYFRPCARHEAGVRQQVSGLVPGLTLRFTVYGHAWSTDAEEPNPRDSTDGGNPGDVIMKAGIDPTGGKDGRSDDIVWGEQKFAYDNHELFSVETVTTGDTVTVFTFSSPNFPVCTNNVYWDDARLEIIP